MNLFKPNCIYNNLKTSIVMYLVLSFITGNIYSIYFQFKITNMFKYSKVTQKLSKQANTMLVWLLISVLVFVFGAIGILLWLTLNTQGFLQFIFVYGLEPLYIPLIIICLASFILAVAWSYKIRDTIRVYNIATYGVNYTSNGFLTFFCPMIVFIWAIENTPNEANLNNLKK